MTRSTYDQTMLDDADRHATVGLEDHLCESCGEPVPCDGIACPHCPWPICKDCAAMENDNADE